MTSATNQKERLVRQVHARARLFLRCSVFALSALLAACGGHAVHVLEPAPTAANFPGASAVEMLAVTNRSPQNAAPGEMFTGERSFTPSFVDISVSIPPERNRKVGDIQWPSQLPANPATDFVTLRADLLSYDGALAKFNRVVGQTSHRRVLLFVHGYNTKFEEAVYRFAQIVHDSEAEAVPILFTWPSRGRLFAYNYDRESSAFSADALGEFIVKLSKNKGVGEIVILAHSMGNLTTLEALHVIGIKYGHVSPKIKQIILASPDVDVDVFQKAMNYMGEPRPPVTLFVSRNDKALAASQYIWEDNVRLGAIDPEIEPYRSMLAKYRIRTIDLTSIDTGDSINHTKFAESPLIVRRIGSRLIDGQDFNSHTPQGGESLGSALSQAASGVGGALTTAAHGPTALVDENSSAAFEHHWSRAGDQFEGVGRHLGDLGSAFGQ